MSVLFAQIKETIKVTNLDITVNKTGEKYSKELIIIYTLPIHFVSMKYYTWQKVKYGNNIRCVNKKDGELQRNSNKINN